MSYTLLVILFRYGDIYVTMGKLMENRTNLNADFVESRLLRYFAVVAEEGSLRKAAERLFISQPPLTRQIKQLEETLGVILFTRHSKGLTLTEEGREVLAIIRPLLKMQGETMERLRQVSGSGKKLWRIGLTTAFEQGTFIRLEARLRENCGKNLRLVRASSPKLASAIRKGRLDAAVIALPLDVPGLESRPVGYTEPLVAALPSDWPQAAVKTLRLSDCSGKPLFWFRRDDNPAFFDYSRSAFAYANYEPVFIEEPREHDVYLARIAAGEGMGLLAESFAAIQRQGVVFRSLQDKEVLYLEMGIVSSPARQRIVEEILPLAGGALGRNDKRGVSAQQAAGEKANSVLTSIPGSFP